MEKKPSFFMKDKRNSDKIEGLAEAFLSWTLQCCDADNAILRRLIYSWNSVFSIR